MKRSRPNQYSLQRIERMRAELPERLKLIERCGGTPQLYTQTIRRKGEVHEVQRVHCMGGTCECGCGYQVPADECQLHPHEELSRGKGGIISAENSKMVRNFPCHARLQNRSPRLEWLK